MGKWITQMAWMPVEEIVRDRQDAYYRAISNADRTGDARLFIEFVLTALRDALIAVKKSVGKDPWGQTRIPPWGQTRIPQPTTKKQTHHSPTPTIFSNYPQIL